MSQSLELFAQFDTLLLVDTKAPVAFFAYPDKPSALTQPGTRFFTLCPPFGNSRAALEALHAAIPNSGENSEVTMYSGVSASSLTGSPGLPQGRITPEKIGALLGEMIPENAIVVDESLTTGATFFAQTAGAPPHDWLSGTGGSIGYAIPAATGAAIACPDRTVIALESDGSGMYMPQTLWTQARENVPVVTLIFANRKYQILRNEMANVGVPEFGATASSLLDLDNPVIDWVSLSRGVGVPATRVENMEALAQAFTAGISSNAPYLIEVVL